MGAIFTIARKLPQHPVLQKLLHYLVFNKSYPKSQVEEDGKNHNKQIYQSDSVHRCQELQAAFHNGLEVSGLRGSPLNEIMEALTNPNINIIGAYGSDDEHKAALVERITRRVKRDDLFDVISMARVTKKPDVKIIQQQLGNNLGLQLDHEKTIVGRAKLVCERMKQVQRILVVLDDVWDHVNFGRIGTPFANDHKGCKIVLISVSSEVLAFHTPAQNYFCVP